MINNIINLFKRKKSQVAVENNTLKIFLDNSESFLKISIFNTHQSDAQAFAQMLCDLHSGKYINAIINTLLDLSKEDQTIFTFVKEVFKYWDDKYQNSVDGQTIDEEPLVKPTYFNRSFNHG